MQPLTSLHAKVCRHGWVHEEVSNDTSDVSWPKTFSCQRDTTKFHSTNATI